MNFLPPTLPVAGAKPDKPFHPHGCPAPQFRPRSATLSPAEVRRIVAELIG
jgi:hypothetical protein